MLHAKKSYEAPSTVTIQFIEDRFQAMQSLLLFTQTRPQRRSHGPPSPIAQFVFSWPAQRSPQI
jgi:hypothetical protein